MDELTYLFEVWRDPGYLYDFFIENWERMTYFRINDIGQAIYDTLEDANELEKIILEFPMTADLSVFFKPLGEKDAYVSQLTREKGKLDHTNRHPSWLRIYAVRLERNVYVVTGGAIKLAEKMQDAEITNEELNKLNACRNYLEKNGVFDKDSFVDLAREG